MAKDPNSNTIHPILSCFLSYLQEVIFKDKKFHFTLWGLANKDELNYADMYSVLRDISSVWENVFLLLFGCIV